MHSINSKRTIAVHAPVIVMEFFPRAVREIGGISGAQYVALIEEVGYSTTMFSKSGVGKIITSCNALRFDDISLRLISSVTQCT
jgi:uncharacterized protein YmfQ (DUF2313 family)